MAWKLTKSHHELHLLHSCFVFYLEILLAFYSFYVLEREKRLTKIHDVYTVGPVKCFNRALVCQKIDSNK